MLSRFLSALFRYFLAALWSPATAHIAMGSNPGFGLAMSKIRKEDDIYDDGYNLRNSLELIDESEILSKASRRDK
jgi:hypothetical protein